MVKTKKKRFTREYWLGNNLSDQEFVTRTLLWTNKFRATVFTTNIVWATRFTGRISWLDKNVCGKHFLAGNISKQSQNNCWAEFVLDNSIWTFFVWAKMCWANLSKPGQQFLDNKNCWAKTFWTNMFRTNMFWKNVGQQLSGIDLLANNVFGRFFLGQIFVGQIV